MSSRTRTSVVLSYRAIHAGDDDDELQTASNERTSTTKLQLMTAVDSKAEVDVPRTTSSAEPSVITSEQHDGRLAGPTDVTSSPQDSATEYVSDVLSVVKQTDNEVERTAAANQLASFLNQALTSRDADDVIDNVAWHRNDSGPHRGVPSNDEHRESTRTSTADRPADTTEDGVFSTNDDRRESEVDPTNEALKTPRRHATNNDETGTSLDRDVQNGNDNSVSISDSNDDKQQTDFFQQTATRRTTSTVDTAEEENASEIRAVDNRAPPDQDSSQPESATVASFADDEISLKVEPTSESGDRLIVDNSDGMHGYDGRSSNITLTTLTSTPDVVNGHGNFAAIADYSAKR